jgi:hypothetical protein
LGDRTVLSSITCRDEDHKRVGPFERDLEFIQHIVKEICKNFDDITIWIRRIVRDEGPGALSLPKALSAVEMATKAMSASTEDMSSGAFRSRWKLSF